MNNKLFLAIMTKINLATYWRNDGVELHDVISAATNAGRVSWSRD